MRKGHIVGVCGAFRAMTAGALALSVALVPALASARDEGQQNEQGQSPKEGNQGTQQPQTESRMSQTTNATLKAAKVERANRIITFEDPHGGTFDVKAGPDINMAKIRPGQLLDVTYYEEVAVAVGKKGEPTTPQSTTVNRGGVTAKQTTMTGQIVSIDHENNTVRVKGPNGQMHTLIVTDPSLQQRLANISPGDNVTLSYTQAVAVAATPHQG